MSLSEFDRRRVEKAVSAYVERRRPPAHLRDQLDIGFLVDGQSVELFTLRPAWDNPDELLQHPAAKATFVKRTQTWKIYWIRADLRWHAYQPAAEVASIEDFLAVVERDECSCFWG